MPTQTSTDTGPLFPEAIVPTKPNIFDSYKTQSAFAFNNSSLAWLSCSQRYVYRVVYGAVQPTAKSLPLTIGSIFHKFVELLGKTEMINLLLSPESWPEFIRDFDRAKALKLLALANQVRLENSHLFPKDNHHQELFGEVPITQDDGIIAKHSFTIDVLTYDAATDTVIVTDFKTTKLPLDGNLVTTYDLKFQRIFYEHCLRLLAHVNSTTPTLNGNFRSAILAGRMKFGYIFINHETNKYVALPPKPYSQQLHDSYAELLREKVAWAAMLHRQPSLARKDGILYDLCSRCEFRHICALHDPSAEAKQFAAWPHGFKQYSAKHDED